MSSFIYLSIRSRTSEANLRGCPRRIVTVSSGIIRGQKATLAWTMSTIAYLSLGSNLGDREGHLRDAVARLESQGHVVAVSSFYETEPVEFANQPWFLNCAVAIETTKMATELLAGLLEIEGSMGRHRAQRKGPRLIDIDILLFGNAIIDSQELTVPHPAMHERRFVIEPLAEIAPEARHPVLAKTVRQLWDSLPPGQVVRRIAGPPMAR